MNGKGEKIFFESKQRKEIRWCLNMDSCKPLTAMLIIFNIFFGNFNKKHIFATLKIKPHT
jgi:hypothetical protein